MPGRMATSAARFAFLMLIGLWLVPGVLAQPVWRGMTQDYRWAGGRAICGTVNSNGPNPRPSTVPDDLIQHFVHNSRYGRITLAPAGGAEWESEGRQNGLMELTFAGRVLLRIEDDPELQESFSIGDFEILHLVGSMPPTGFYFRWSAFFRIDARGNWCMTVPFANWSMTEDPFPPPRRRDRATVWLGVGQGNSHYAHYDGRRLWFEQRWVDPTRPAPEELCREFHDFAIYVLMADEMCRTSRPPPPATLAPWRAGSYIHDLQPGLPFGTMRPIYFLVQDPRIRGLAFARMVYANCTGAPIVDQATFRRRVCGR